MSELVRIPGVFGLSNHLGEAVVQSMVGRGDLPPDFYFRLLAFDLERREDIAITDVLAALGFNDESPEAADYLHGSRPDCVFLPGFRSCQDILESISEDYYQLADLLHASEEAQASSSIAHSMWWALIARLNPPLRQKFEKNLFQPQIHRAEAGNSLSGQFKRALGRVVIRDEALMSIYADTDSLPGFGPQRRSLLRLLLLDNHPELAE